MRGSWLMAAGLGWALSGLGMTVPVGTWQPVDRAVFEAKYGDTYPVTVPTDVRLIGPTDTIYVYTLGTANTSHCTLLPYKVRLGGSTNGGLFSAKGNEVALTKPTKFSEISFTFHDFNTADGYATRCLIHAFASIEPEPSVEEKERALFKPTGKVEYSGGYIRALDYDLVERLALRKLRIKIPTACSKKMEILEVGTVQNDQFHRATPVHNGPEEYFYQVDNPSKDLLTTIRLRVNGRTATDNDKMECPIEVSALLWSQS
ncbi:MAG: hypothetical protein KDD51_06160 [Bdellovibrionales bacterium]|nr:hypothetical protein [Bdellovibrionales bacterium]